MPLGPELQDSRFAQRYSTRYSDSPFTPKRRRPSCHAPSSRARAWWGVGIASRQKHGQWRLDGGRGGTQPWRRSWRRSCRSCVQNVIVSICDNWCSSGEGETASRDVLAVVAAERDLVGGLSGLVDRLGLLGVEGKALLAVEGNANSLVVYETGMLRGKKSALF